MSLNADPATLAALLLRAEVEAFLVREARLLDEEQYDAWLELMHPDILYWMPATQSRYRRDKAPAYAMERLGYFEDGLEDLRRRVDRARQPTAWAEDPPTRRVHMVSNVEVEAEADGDLIVRSIVLNTRNRTEDHEEWLMVRRTDRLVRLDGALRIRERTITTPQAVLLTRNLNEFF